MLGDLRGNCLNSHPEMLFALFIRCLPCNISTLRAFGYRHRESLALAIANHHDFDFFTHDDTGHDFDQFMGILNIIPIYFDNDVSRFDPCLVGRITREDIRYQRPFFRLQLQVLGNILRDALNGNPQPTARHLSLGFQIGQDIFRHVNRNGKPDSLSLGNNRRIDTHHLSLQIEERPPTVSRIDGGIRLYKIIIRAGSDDPPLGADDPGRHRF